MPALEVSWIRLRLGDLISPRIKIDISVEVIDKTQRNFDIAS